MYLFDDIANYVTSKNANDEISRLIESQLGDIDSIKTSDFGGSYTPFSYSTPEEAKYSQVNIDPTLRSAQLAGLQALKDRSSGVADAQSELGRFQAINDANQLARGRGQAILADAQARGMGGSALQFALSQQGDQDAAMRGQSAGLQAAQQAALERLSAQGQYNQGLSNLRGQDTSLAEKNADIINQFNMANTQARNQTSQMNTQMQNQGQQYNLERGDRNQQAQFQQNLQKQGAKSGLIGQKIGNISDQANNNSRLTTGLTQTAANAASLGVGYGLGGGIGAGAGSAVGNLDPNQFKLKSQYGWF